MVTPDVHLSESNWTRERPGPEPWLSVVVPAYCEEGNVEPLWQGLEETLGGGPSWELIVVDDGSSDQTWNRIVGLQRRDARVRGVRLSRNFGHQSALLAGLARARGAAVITMDADLQHPPSVVPLLVEEWRRGARIVHTIRSDSNDLSWFKRTASRTYYRLFTLLSGVPITPGMADFRLLDRQVVDELLQFREVDVFLRGLVEWVGYPAATVKFQAAARYSGNPKYTFRRMLKFAWTGITSFSLIPLRAGIIIGLVTAVLSFAALVHAVWVRLVTPQDAVPGWATIVALIGLFFGILFVLIGVLGEYLARILVQVRQRPRFLVSGTVGFGAASAPAHTLEGQHATPPARPGASA